MFCRFKNLYFTRMNNPVANKQKNNKLILFTCTSFCEDVVLSGCSAEFTEHPSILAQQPRGCCAKM